MQQVIHRTIREQYSVFDLRYLNFYIKLCSSRHVFYELSNITHF